MNHSFNVEYACQYGIEEAILIENFSFWIIKNKANKANTREIEIEGKKCKRTFTYNSASAMTELFPYLTQKQIYRVMESLINQGVLVRKYFNQNTYNRTSWYCFADEDHFTKSGNAIPKKEKSILPNREMDFTESGNHYTDINTDINTDVKKDKEEISFASKSKADIFQEHHKTRLKESRLHGDPDLFLLDKLGQLVDWDTETYDKILNAKKNSKWEVRRNQPNTARWLLATLENENIEQKQLAYADEEWI